VTREAAPSAETKRRRSSTGRRRTHPRRSVRDYASLILRELRNGVPKIMATTYGIEGDRAEIAVSVAASLRTDALALGRLRIVTCGSVAGPRDHERALVALEGEHPNADAPAVVVWRERGERVSHATTRMSTIDELRHIADRDPNEESFGHGHRMLSRLNFGDALVTLRWSTLRYLLYRVACGPYVPDTRQNPLKKAEVRRR
jgi:hypothetical protein